MLQAQPLAHSWGTPGFGAAALPFEASFHCMTHHNSCISGAGEEIFLERPDLGCFQGPIRSLEYGKATWAHGKVHWPQLQKTFLLIP